MKKFFIILAASLMLFAACTPKTQTEAIDESAPKVLESVQSIDANKVAYIERYDGSKDPDTAAGTWCSDADVESMINYFKSIRLTEQAGDENHGMDTPGASSYYVIEFLDGSAMSIGFSLGTVKTEDGWYSYTGERPEDDGIVLWIDEYNADTGEIAFVISKHNKLQYYAFGAPTLERMTETGWEEVDVKKASSAVREPLEEGRNTFRIAVDDLAEGTYRVSQTVAKGEINLNHVEYETYSGILEIQ